LLEIPGEEQFIGRPYGEVLEFLLQRGEFAESLDHEKTITDRLRSLRNGETHRIERVRPNGVVLSVTAASLPSGGYDTISTSPAKAGPRKQSSAMPRQRSWQWRISPSTDTSTGV
jgi:hypothetical protein